MKAKPKPRTEVLAKWPDLTPLLDRIEAAAYLNVSYQLLRNWATAKQGPPMIKLGRLVRYRVADLDKWLDDGRKENAVPQLI